MRNPCLIFWILIALCVIIAFLLQVVVFRAAEGGNPFTLPGNEFDLADVRSVQYESYRLARDELRGARNALVAVGTESVKQQSEVSDITYWVFEGETDGGLFGSRGAIEGMKDAYDIFMKDREFEKWCVPEYPDEDASFGLFGRSLRDAAKRFPDAARHLEGAARRLEARRLQDASADAGADAGAETGGRNDVDSDAAADAGVRERVPHRGR